LKQDQRTSVVSPTGRYEISFHSHEAFNSCWVDTPTLRDKQNGETLFAIQDDRWSLDELTWRSESVVSLEMRKYPGNHEPQGLEVTVDCTARQATIGGQIVGLSELEQRMEAALTWIHAKPAAPPAGVFARLHRFMRGR
jgi:hypothetical protein